MLISIIVVVKDCASTMQQCIDSVSNQTFQDKELIIIDGGSTDGTVDILKANESKFSYWESKPDRGIYHAWNKALNHVNGDWIYYLGADDYLWEDSVLEKIAVYLESGSSRVIYGKVNVVNQFGKVLGTYGEPWEKIKNNFQELMVIPHQGVFHHISLFNEYGKFDERYKISGDYEFLLRDLKSNNALFIDNIIVTGMRHGGVSSNASYKLQALSEIAIASKKYRVGGLRVKWRWTYTKAYIRWLLAIIMGKSITNKIVNYYRLFTKRIPIE